jgi:hypothetical protein
MALKYIARPNGLPLHEKDCVSLATGAFPTASEPEGFVPETVAPSLILYEYLISVLHRPPLDVPLYAWLHLLHGSEHSQHGLHELPSIIPMGYMPAASRNTA